MSISFCAKIPISTSNIYNRKTESFETATMYEVNCKDKEDIAYIQSAKGNWLFKRYISEYAKVKHDSFSNPYLSKKDKKFLNKIDFILWKIKKGKL